MSDHDDDDDILFAAADAGRSLLEIATAALSVAGLPGQPIFDLCSAILGSIEPLGKLAARHDHTRDNQSAKVPTDVVTSTALAAATRSVAETQANEGILSVNYAVPSKMLTLISVNAIAKALRTDCRCLTLGRFRFVKLCEDFTGQALKQFAIDTPSFEEFPLVIDVQRKKLSLRLDHPTSTTITKDRGEVLKWRSVDEWFEATLALDQKIDHRTKFDKKIKSIIISSRLSGSTARNKILNRLFFVPEPAAR